MRRPLVAGNWKMHGSIVSARALAKEVAAGAERVAGVEIAVCPPFPYLGVVREVISTSTVSLGGQNAHPASEGSFTGEVSMPMLRDAGCVYVIVGHSERRRHFGETDESVRSKVGAALEHALTPIVCVGETESEREAGRTAVVLERQVRGGLDPVLVGSRDLDIAYEPVWAIGTGRTANPEMVAAAHRGIREIVSDVVGEEAAARTRILYGGSVKPENAAALLAADGVDGALVGGASLDARSFLAIATAARPGR